MAKSEIPQYMLEPFRVVHSDGSVVQGFKDIESAKEDAENRNTRAKEMGLSDCVYSAIKKDN